MIAGISPGEILLSVVLGLLAVSFGKWASRLDRMVEAVEKMKNELHDYIVKMERRLSRVEERVRHHEHLIAARNKFVAGIEDADDDEDE
jgi:type II secretory pathway component PulJ